MLVQKALLHRTISPGLEEAIFEFWKTESRIPSAGFLAWLVYQVALTLTPPLPMSLELR